MLIWVLVIVVVSVSCNTQTQSVRTLPTPAPLPDILAGTVEEWELTDVLLRSVRRDGTVESKTVFRVRLPQGWDVRHAQVGGDSWGGELIGDDFSLGYSGGPMAVSELYKIIGNGPVLFDQELADQHVVTEEEDAGISRTMVRPRGEEGRFTGAPIHLLSRRILVSKWDLTEEHQAVAFSIIRSITP
jgi:hypothetical protein